MTQSRWPFIGGIMTLAVLGGLTGGLNVLWSRQPVFPVYGYIADACIITVMIYVLIRFRKWKAESTDEFAVTKIRFAAQTGFIFGFLIYAVSNALPFFFPNESKAFIATMHDARVGFIIGRVFGMAPFVLGLLIGQVFSWLKYR